MVAVIPFNDLKRHNDALADELSAALERVRASGWYVLGPEGESFEAEFAAWCGAAGCVGVANGTDALEVALRSAGVERGDEVITAANAGGYASIACLAIGATPVYADVDPATLGLDPTSAAAAVSDRTAAVVVTHLYGIVADVDGLRAQLPRPLPIIEDAAQAHGASRGGQRAGTLGDLATFSFYPTKNLGALGDAGAVVSDDPALLERARMLRQYGWSERNRADVTGGRNSRLDELQAAVLRTKLPHVDGWNKRRREIVDRWDEALGDRVEVLRPVEGVSSAHLCVVRHRDRDALRRDLADRDVATGVHFATPDHRQPAFAAAPAGTVLPITDRACGEVLSLPCFPELRDDELEQAIDILARLLGPG